MSLTMCENYCTCRLRHRCGLQARHGGEHAYHCAADPRVRATGEIYAVRLHWPFTAKHPDCVECDREYEPLPRRVRQ